MLKFPLSPRKMVSLVGEVQSQASESARLLIAGYDSQALDTVSCSLLAEASPAVADRMVEKAVLARGNGFIPRSSLESTAAIILVSSTGDINEDGFGERLNQLAVAGVPLVLVLTEAPGVEISFPAAGVGPKRVVGIAPDGKPPVDVLAEAVVNATGDAAVFLAAQLPVLRKAACDQIIRRTARQNGVIGVLFIIPGADMPVMTLNQARMVLRIAAAHGDTIGTERALELLSVIGGGLCLRTLARQALDLVPGPGWVLKGSIGYSGTLAMGMAAKAYFDGSVRVTPSRLARLAEKIKSLRG